MDAIYTKLFQRIVPVLRKNGKFFSHGRNLTKLFANKLFTE